MAVLTEATNIGDLLKYEEDELDYSRDAVTILSGQDIAIGRVLGKVTAGTATGAAVAGNTGNGAISAVSAGSAAKKVGVYMVTCIEAAANGGTFAVEDPDGVIVGSAVVGTPYAGPVNFSLADGATDFVAGDRFAITVAAGSGKYKAHDPANTDGSQVAVAVALQSVDATAADMPGVVIARHAILAESYVLWTDGISAGNKAAAIAQLKALGILIRTAA